MQITTTPSDNRHHLSLDSTVLERTLQNIAGHMGPVPILVNNAEAKNLSIEMTLPSVTN